MVFTARRVFILACPQGIRLRAHVGAEVASPQGWRYPLLVESRAGYQNLCRLITQMKLRGKKGEGHAFPEEVAEKAQGLICLTGGDEGPLAHSLAQEGFDAAIDRVEQLCAMFGRENVYIELQRHFHRDEEARNQAAIAIAQKLRLPLLATNGVAYARPPTAPTAGCLYLHSEPSNACHCRPSAQPGMPSAI